MIKYKYQLIMRSFSSESALKAYISSKKKVSRCSTLFWRINNYKTNTHTNYQSLKRVCLFDDTNAFKADSIICIRFNKDMTAFTSFIIEMYINIKNHLPYLRTISVSGLMIGELNMTIQDHLPYYCIVSQVHSQTECFVSAVREAHASS